MNKLYQKAHSSHLIILQRNIDRVCIKVSVRFTLLNFVLINDRVHVIKINLVLLIKQSKHAARIKCEDRAHVAHVQLQESFVEEGWVRLHLDKG